MSIRRSIGCFALLLVAACQNEPGEGPPELLERGATAPTQAAETEAQSGAKLLPGETRELVLDGRRVVESVRHTADGELIRIRTPEPAPSIEVGEGARCGIVNQQGAVLSCQAGTFCASPSAEAQATCVRAAAAPKWDG